MCGPGSIVGIATGYGVDGPGTESRWGWDFPHLSRPALGPTQPPVQWVPGLSRGKERLGRDADPSRLLVPWSWKDRAIPLLPLWAVRPVQSLSACTRMTFTFTFYTNMWLLSYELWMFIVAVIFINNGMQCYTRANMDEDDHVKWLFMGFFPIQFVAWAHSRMFDTQ